jgi:hypothetical protein
MTDEYPGMGKVLQHMADKLNADRRALIETLLGDMRGFGEQNRLLSELQNNVSAIDALVLKFGVEAPELEQAKAPDVEAPERRSIAEIFGQSKSADSLENDIARIAQTLQPRRPHQ